MLADSANMQGATYHLEDAADRAHLRPRLAAASSFDPLQRTVADRMLQDDVVSLLSTEKRISLLARTNIVCDESKVAIELANVRKRGSNASCSRRNLRLKDWCVVRTLYCATHSSKDLRSGMSCNAKAHAHYDVPARMEGRRT